MNNKYILVCTTFFIIAVLITRFTFYLSNFAEWGDCFCSFSLRASRAAAHNSVLFPAGWTCAGGPASQEDDFHLALSDSSRLLLWGEQLPCWKSLSGRNLSVAFDPQPRRKRILPAITWVGEIHPQLSLERSIACERPWWRRLRLPAPGFLTHENRKTIHVCDVKLLSLGGICYAVIANRYTSATQYRAHASFCWVTLSSLGHRLALASFGEPPVWLLLRHISLCSPGVWLRTLVPSSQRCCHLLVCSQGQGLEEWSLVPTVMYSSSFQNDEDDMSPRFLGDRRTWKSCEDCDSRTSEK